MRSIRETIVRDLPLVLLFSALFLVFFFKELPLPSLVSQEGTYVILVAATVVFVDSLTRKAILSRIERIHSMGKRRRLLKSLLVQFNEFLSLFTFERVDLSIVSNGLVKRAEEPYCVNVIREVFSSSARGLSRNQVDSVVLFWLCYQWSKTRRDVSLNTIESFEHLDAYFRSAFTDLRYSPQTAEMATAYRNVRLCLVGNKVSPRGIRDIFRGEVRFREYTELIMDFTSKYAQQLLFNALRVRKGDELRATITRLINEGSLTLYGVDRELNLKYQEELLKYASSTNLYLIFKNLHKELGDHLEKLPQIRLPPVLIPVNLPFQTDQASRVYSRIVKPVNPYPTASDFIGAEIKPYMKGDGGFVAILPIDAKNSRILPTQEDFETDSSYVSGNYQLISYLLTGRQEPDIPLWALLTGRVSPQVLLSTIPFTILGEHLTPEENSVLWQNYPQIKDRFHVHQLTDWGKVDPVDIADHLIAELPFFDESHRERILKISESIVKEAQVIGAAMIPQTYDILAPNPVDVARSSVEP